ncbi:MAG: hypothetical protein DSO00_08475, partial [Archaeoglobi archaeon]
HLSLCRECKRKIEIDDEILSHTFKVLRWLDGDLSLPGWPDVKECDPEFRRAIKEEALREMEEVFNSCKEVSPTESFTEVKIENQDADFSEMKLIMDQVHFSTSHFNEDKDLSLESRAKQLKEEKLKSIGDLSHIFDMTRPPSMKGKNTTSGLLGWSAYVEPKKPESSLAQSTLAGRNPSLYSAITIIIIIGIGIAAFIGIQNYIGNRKQTPLSLVKGDKVIKGVVGKQIKQIEIKKEERLQIVKETPEWKIHFENGLELERQKKWELAASEFQKAAELAPENADCWRRLGHVFLKNGNRKEAAEAYRKYLDLRPNAYDAPYIKALIKNW